MEYEGLLSGSYESQPAWVPILALSLSANFFLHLLDFTLFYFTF